MSNMLSLIITICGVIIALVGIFETWVAVLYPRAFNGPVTSAIYRSYHYISQRILGPESTLLLFSGPVLIVIQVAAWASLLLLGVSLVVWPQLGTSIVSVTDVTDQRFGTAVYYAGYCITTLGTGDLVPKTTFAQMVTTTAAVVGFSFFTLVLAYVISVYSALERRNQFASEIDYRMGRTGDTLAYLKGYLATNDGSLLKQDMFTLASGLADLLESHHFYPALHYFRFREKRYSMSRILRFCLEVSSAFRSLNESASKKENPEPADRLWHSSLQTLEDTMEHFVICRVPGNQEDITIALRIAEHLKSCNTGARFDEEVFVAAYQNDCKQWFADLESLAHCTMTDN
ncbi:potassium channel family protein [Bremerella sp. T1]|uniref:potassium channel family protein n=1 Tax=Bremerella sp. TYQ1 TaxID=3119568 RepID=UPI001CCA08F1|nr:potassium channel family protein [Bremerella volcania]UBM36393.1 potassium channel family protein [Bremerella volcania]